MSTFTGRQHATSMFQVDKNQTLHGSGATERRSTSGQTQTFPLSISEEKRSVVPIFFHQKSSDRSVEFPISIDNVEQVTIGRLFIAGLSVPVNSIVVMRFTDVNRHGLSPKTMNNLQTSTMSTLFAPSKDGMTVHELFQCPSVIQIHRSTRNLKSMQVSLEDIDGSTITFDHISIWGFAYSMDWDA